jgi:uncharacterized 2Fe-2S/4Fe-4S cluster protein (DUF4445 family)
VQEAREVLACQLPAEDGMIIETTTSQDVQVLASSIEKTFNLNPIVAAHSGAWGVAVDIGTTTMVGYLLDLQTGQELAVTSMANPQRVYGADVISRIAYTQENPGGVEELQKILVQALNGIITNLCDVGQIRKDNIKAMTIAGNTVILHTLLGVSAVSIANAPFEPIFSHGQTLAAKELGIEMAEEGSIFTLPCVSGYVGADIIGGLLVCDLEKEDSYGLLIDIGTNGEIVLGNKRQMIACSTAAGPAFEGAKISSGMAGVRGAIASFSLRDGARVYETIGGAAPLGICGSGLMDIMAELLAHGFIDSTGAFAASDGLAPWQREMLTTVNGMPAFVVVPGTDITFTQRDVREVQLAKGAIRAGVFTLLKEGQIAPAQIGTVFLAGGFGNFVDVHSACVVGLIPEELEERVVRIGNGAGLGAKLCLLDKTEFDRGIELKKRIQYIELSTRADFQELFMDAMFF